MPGGGPEVALRLPQAWLLAGRGPRRSAAGPAHRRDHQEHDGQKSSYGLVISDTYRGSMPAEDVLWSEGIAYYGWVEEEKDKEKDGAKGKAANLKPRLMKETRYHCVLPFVQADATVSRGAEEKLTDNPIIHLKLGEPTKYAVHEFPEAVIPKLPHCSKEKGTWPVFVSASKPPTASPPAISVRASGKGKRNMQYVY